MHDRAYAESFKDPRWQKLRLETFERDGWACRRCAAKDVELNAHHTYYEFGQPPWSYPPRSIVTYCNDCHETIHASKKGFDRDLSSMFYRLGFSEVDIANIALILVDAEKTAIALGVNGAQLVKTFIGLSLAAIKDGPDDRLELIRKVISGAETYFDCIQK